MSTRKLNIQGKTFGRLVVISPADKIGSRTAWKCTCICGGTKITTTDRLVSGKTTSCGCRKLEAARENCEKNKIKPTHGMTNSPTWNSWAAMVYRCTNEDGRQFPTYKGKLCDRWKIFENFYEDMGKRPNGTSIDRIDVNGIYEKNNCRWATSKEQQNNKTNTRYVVVDGQKIPLMVFADRIGIKKSQAQYFYSTILLLKNKNLTVTLE